VLILGPAVVNRAPAANADRLDRIRDHARRFIAAAAIQLLATVGAVTFAGNV
jgi:hypothetical protein